MTGYLCHGVTLAGVKEALGRRIRPGEVLAVYNRRDRKVLFFRFTGDPKQPTEFVRFYDKRREPVYCRPGDIRVKIEFDGRILTGADVPEVVENPDW